jgi:hypothetical protein
MKAFLFLFNFTTFKLESVKFFGASKFNRNKVYNVGGSVRGLGVLVHAPSEAEARAFYNENPVY